MKIPVAHRIANHYVQHFGLEVGSPISVKESGLYYVDGKNKKISDVLADTESAAYKVNQKWAAIKEELFKISLARLSEMYDDLTLTEFLVQRNWSKEEIYSFLVYNDLVPVAEMSFLAIFRVEFGGDRTSFKLIEGGAHQLPNKIAATEVNGVPLSAKINTECTLKEVIYTDNKATVTYDSPKGPITEEFDYVVIAIPFSLVNLVNFSPPLPISKKHMMMSQHYLVCLKVFIKTKSRFWEKYGISGAVLTDLPVQTIYLSSQSKDNEKGTMTVYMLEKNVHRFRHMSTKDMENEVVRFVSLIFPETAEQMEDVRSFFWDESRGGAFSFYRRNYMENVRSSEEPLGPIYFSGEHTSIENGWFEGALSTGISAAYRINLRHSKIDNIKETPNFTDILHLIRREPLVSLPIRRLDHYTIIVPNALDAAEYHIQKLGFHFLKLQTVNTGTVPEGEFDMLNYILTPPHDPTITLVITQGLTKETIFHRYLDKYGQGIHHVAFEVENIDHTFEYLVAHGFKITSESIIRDMLSGLRQLFLDCSYAGVFIEFIERSTPSQESVGHFVSDNMKQLALSIESYLGTSSSHNGKIDNTWQNKLLPEKLIVKPEILLGKLKGFKLVVRDMTKAQKFLENVLGFDRVGNAFYIADGRTLELETGETQHAIAVYTGNPEKIQEHLYNIREKAEMVGNSVLLDAQKIGYPIHVVVKDNTSRSSVSRNIHASFQYVFQYITEYLNFTQWTMHKLIIPQEDKWAEFREVNGKMIAVPFQIVPGYQSYDKCSIAYCWGEPLNYQVDILLRRVSETKTNISVTVPANWTRSRKWKAQKLLHVELEVLKVIIEKRKDNSVSALMNHFLQSTRDSRTALQVYLKDHFPEYAFEPEHTKFSHDFGGQVFAKPLLVIHAKSVADITKCVELANHFHLPLVFRGVGHSTSGISLAEDGVVVDMSTFCQVIGNNFEATGTETKWLDVQPGIKWSVVVAETSYYGYTPPILPDWLSLTVGGTLSVGGIGNRSFSEGFQVEHVLEADIMDGYGTIHTCSPTQNSELFYAALSGLGQFGIMTRVRLECVKSPPTVTIYKVIYANVENFLKDFQEFTKNKTFTCLHGFLVNNRISAVQKKLGVVKRDIEEKLDNYDDWLYYMEATTFNYETPKAAKKLQESVNRIVATEIEFNSISDPVIEIRPFTVYTANVPPVMQRNTSKTEEILAHIEYCCFLSWSHVQKYLKHIEEVTNPNHPFEVLIEPVLSPQKKFFSLPKNGEPMVFVLFVRTTPNGNKTLTENWMLECKRLESFSKILNANRYFVDSNLPANPQEWEGWIENWESNLQIKKKYDPHHLFVPYANLWQ